MKKLFMKSVHLTLKKVTGAPFPSQVTRTDNAGQDERGIHPYPSGTWRPRTKLNPPTNIFPFAVVSDTSADQQLLASSRMLPSHLHLLQNTSLGLLPTSGPYPIGPEETNAVSNGKVVFATGNYFAALSTDGGAHFDYLDPTTVFPTADGGFCCDQVVEYSPQIDRFIWVLQYAQDGNNENRYRVAFASTDDLLSGKGTTWSYYDLTSSNLGLEKAWMDFPDLVVGGKSLYLTANITLSTSDQIALMTRTPLSALQSGDVTVTYFTWDQNIGFRITRNCQSRLFWAAHNSDSQIRVFTWDEGTTTVSWHDVDVSSWNSSDVEAYKVTLPDGVIWDNIHNSMLGATKAGNNLVFAWTAGREGTNVPVKDRMLQPYIQMAIVDTTSFSLNGENYIWQQENAFAVPALATNSNDEVGISLGWGGPNRYVNNVVGIVTGTAEYIETTNATRSSTSWGHYVSVHQGYPNREQFVASGFAIQSDPADPGGALGDPHYIVFGRSGV